MKKVIKVFLLIVTSAVIGAGTFLALEFIENGGTAEELKSYIKGTVIPTVMTVITALFALYFGCSPKLNDMSKASDGLLAAKDIMGSVSKASADTSQNVEVLSQKLLAQIEQNEAQREIINAMIGKIEVMQQMMATGFGNMPELVKSGNARTIYALMEGKSDETED